MPINAAIKRGRVLLRSHSSTTADEPVGTPAPALASEPLNDAAVRRQVAEWARLGGLEPAPGSTARPRLGAVGGRASG